MAHKCRARSFVPHDADPRATTEMQIDSVEGYGAVSIVCVSDGPALNFLPIEETDKNGSVEAPYYWGYDKRYAQTYKEGG
jgi:hypothetical protein